MNDDDERRRTALLNYAKALLKYCQDNGDEKAAKYWKKEIEMLDDEITKPCHNYKQSEAKQGVAGGQYCKKKRAITSIARISDDGLTLQKGLAIECFEEKE